MPGLDDINVGDVVLTHHIVLIPNNLETIHLAMLNENRHEILQLRRRWQTVCASRLQLTSLTGKKAKNAKYNR